MAGTSFTEEDTVQFRQRVDQLRDDTKEAITEGNVTEHDEAISKLIPNLVKK